MRQLALLFILLLGCFLGSWTYKIKTPVNRPDEYTEGYDPDAGAWWKGEVQVDDDWKLDPEIDPNYIPVPGEDELYMVVDNNGNIIKYRKRTKQIDGTWKWEDVNPDIPENYEPVEGLENVYKVVDENGNVKYLKYIRNEDDTFAFVEVDENGNEIGYNRDATKIDGKHVHITGNTYKRLDDNGVVIGYDLRVDNGDGTFSWMSTELPKLDDLSDLGDGLTLPSSGSGNSNVPKLDTSSLDAMAQAMADANANWNSDSTSTTININPGQFGQQGEIAGSDAFAAPPIAVNNPDGTHTEITTYRETRNENGNMVTYEQTVRKTYNDAGDLIQTETSAPTPVPVSAEISENIVKETEPTLKADRSNVKESLSDEEARVTGSYTYDNDLASHVYALLNSQRQSNLINTLSIDDTAMKIAALRAADMATYDVSSGDLPTYGSLGAMLAKFKISSAVQPAENVSKSNLTNAQDIHSRFQAIDSSRNIRMNEANSKYGIAIVNKNGYNYICEVFM